MMTKHIPILSYLFLFLSIGCIRKDQTRLYKFLLDDGFTKFEISVPEKYDTIYVTKHRPESPDTITIHHIQNRLDPMHKNTTWKISEGLDPSPIQVSTVYDSKSEINFKSVQDKLEFYESSLQLIDSLARVRISKIVNNDLAIFGYSTQTYSYVFAWKFFNKNDIELLFSSKDSTNFFNESETIIKTLRVR